MVSVISDVDEISRRINSHPEYSHCLRNRLVDATMDDARRHSLALEDKGEQNEASFLEALERLEMAEDFLGVNGINVYSLSQLGHIIEPKKNPNSGFRKSNPPEPESVHRGVRADEFKVQPPLAIDVPQRIRDLETYLSSTSDHSIIRAAEAHLQLVYAHPYFDGNGRASRMAQNHCLLEAGLPPAVIKDEDRSVYYGIIQEALMERAEKQSSPWKFNEKDRLFHEFVASKVLAAVKDIDYELRVTRAYEVSFKRVRDKAILYTLAKKIRNVSKGANKRVPITVNVDKNDGGELRVVGDIGGEELDEILTSGAERYRFKYEVRRLGR